MNDDSPNQTYSRLAPTPAVPRIEWRAIVVACAVGFALIAFESMNLQSFIAANRETIFSWETPWKTHFILAGIQCCFSLANGAAIGFLSARLSHFHKYSSALIAVVFIFLLKDIRNVIWMAQMGGSPPWLAMLETAGQIFFLAPSALFGAFIAQSFERNRGVPID